MYVSTFWSTYDIKKGQQVALSSHFTETQIKRRETGFWGGLGVGFGLGLGLGFFVSFLIRAS